MKKRLTILNILFFILCLALKAQTVEESRVMQETIETLSRNKQIKDYFLNKDIDERNIFNYRNAMLDTFNFSDFDSDTIIIVEYFVPLMANYQFSVYLSARKDSYKTFFIEYENEKLVAIPKKLKQHLAEDIYLRIINNECHLIEKDSKIKILSGTPSERIITIAIKKEKLYHIEPYSY